MTTPTNETRTGFSLLTSEEIESLLDATNGYSSLHVPGLAFKSKKTLVLDVDSTILSGSPWAAEVCVGDIVQPCHSAGTNSNYWKVTSLLITTTRTKATVVMQNNVEIRNFFARHMNDGVYVSGVWLYNWKNEHSGRPITTAELQCQFVPCFHSVELLHAFNLRRKNMAPVSFFSHGYLFRLRPNLASFLSFISTRFHVVIFTSAPRQVYTKVLEYIRSSLSSVLGTVTPWERELFREDCDQIGTKFHKNITKLGVDLSQIVMIDDKQESFEGFEPNAIRIAKFNGQTFDEELLRIIDLLQESVMDARDVRYPLCGLRDFDETPSRGSGGDDNDTDSVSSSLTSNAMQDFETSCDFLMKGLSTTAKFLDSLGEIYQEDYEEKFGIWKKLF